MKTDRDYTNIYTGSEVSVILLKGLLEAEGIATLVKNEHESGRVAGFSGGSYSGVRLYVMEMDKGKALEIKAQFEKGGV